MCVILIALNFLFCTKYLSLNNGVLHTVHRYVYYLWDVFTIVCNVCILITALSFLAVHVPSLDQCGGLHHTFVTLFVGCYEPLYSFSYIIIKGL